MKAYTYSAQECGLRELPKGTLRLGGFEPTSNPKEADAFIVPCDIRFLTDAQIAHLPYLSGNERRHAFFCISDRYDRALHLPAIIFRADANKWLMQEEPSTIPWPWPVNPQGDIDRFAHAPREGFKYDVCFVGWNSTPLTAQSCESVTNHSGLKSFIQMSREFYGTLETRNDVQLEYFRHLFLDTMHNSRLSLCARSIKQGVVRYRFYEAMAMGRIPVHINDNVALPFPDKIDYDKCSIHVAERDADRVGEILRDWLDHHSDVDILERGDYGREMWLEWMDGRKWDQIFGQCARERMSRINGQ